MTQDPLYQAELAHDSGVNAEPFLKAALDSLVDDLMVGLKPRGMNWNLHDFLEDQADLAELAAAVIISGDFETFKDMIEGRLKRELQDSDAVFDRAVELSEERD